MSWCLWFVSVICVGDAMTGVYLLLITISDFVQGKTFCANHTTWLSGWPCDALGILSTFGSCISVYSMTFLSISRAVGISRSLCTQTLPCGPFKVASFLGLFAAAISSLPVILTRINNPLENMFVNGQTWSKQLKFFVGVLPFLLVNLQELGYYGRFLKIKRDSEVMRWDKITSLVRGMYTTDYGNLEGLNNLVGFYGNEGVCVFKYFVLPDDPQFFFVLAFKVLNISCLVMICFCYVVIGYYTRQSVQRLMAAAPAGENHVTQR
eukprot:sb/3468307/